MKEVDYPNIFPSLDTSGCLTIDVIAEELPSSDRTTLDDIWCVNKGIKGQFVVQPKGQCPIMTKDHFFYTALSWLKTR